VQAAALAEFGHEAVPSPMLVVEHLAANKFLLSGAQALIVTSRNALRAIARFEQLPDVISMPLFVVGGATAKLARELGFENVSAGPGTAEDLVPMIRSVCDPARGPLVHLAGETVAWDLKGALEADGFTVRQPVLYRTTPATELTAKAAEAFRTSTLDGVVLMSPASAATYAALVKRHHVAEQAARLVHYCLSEKVAAALEELPGVAIRVAEKPSQEDLLALIGRDAAN
jgi:uroporphyrinogen-III synthase